MSRVCGVILSVQPKQEIKINLSHICGGRFALEVGDKHFGNWQGTFQKMKSESVSSNSPQIARRKLEKKMSVYRDGTRGSVSVVWKDGSGGHVFKED